MTPGGAPSATTSLLAGGLAFAGRRIDGSLDLNPFADLVGESMVGAVVIAMTIILTRWHREDMRRAQDEIQRIADRSYEAMTRNVDALGGVAKSLASVAAELKQLRGEVQRSSSTAKSSTDSSSSSSRKRPGH